MLESLCFKDLAHLWFRRNKISKSVLTGWPVECTRVVASQLIHILTTAGAVQFIHDYFLW